MVKEETDSTGVVLLVQQAALGRLVARLSELLSLLLHGAVKEEVGGQGLIPLAQQERLDAAVAIKAQALQAANGGLLLLGQVYCDCARGQACMSGSFRELCAQWICASRRQKLLRSASAAEAQAHQGADNCMVP